MSCFQKGSESKGVAGMPRSSQHLVCHLLISRHRRGSKEQRTRSSGRTGPSRPTRIGAPYRTRGADGASCEDSARASCAAGRVRAGRDGSARSWEGWLRRYPVSSVPTTSIRGDCDPSDLLRSACGVIPHREVVPAVSTHTPLTAGTSIRSAAAVVGCHRGREIPVTTW